MIIVVYHPVTDRRQQVHVLRNRRRRWRKASYSNPNGACVEVSARPRRCFSRWRKALISYANGNCVEVGQGGMMIGIRDTQQAHLGRTRTVLEFGPEAWREFTAGLKLE